MAIITPSIRKKPSSSVASQPGSATRTPKARPASPAAFDVYLGGGGGQEQMDREAPGFPLKSAALILLTAVALFAASDHYGYLLGQIAAPILAIGTLHGLWRGGFRKIVMLAATVGLLYGVTAGGGCAAKLLGGGQPSRAAGWSYAVLGLAGIVALLMVSAVVKSVRKNMIVTRPLACGVDRIVGVIVGLIEPALLVLAVCWTVTEIRPHAQLIRDHRDTEVGSFRHQMATQMVRLADEADRGVVGRLVRATNPFDQIPMIRKAIDELNTTGQCSLFDLSKLDPQTADGLNAVLKQTPAGDLGGLNDVIEQYKRSNEARDKAYRQLPSQSGNRR